MEGYLFPFVRVKGYPQEVPAVSGRHGVQLAAVEDHFLTLPQVAELLHVSEKTIFNMTRDGRLPARRLPGSRRYLYVRKEILDLLDQTRTGPAPEDQDAEAIEEADAET